jgi:uncharacterized lipoprotein YddW (UPF0748 family)
VSTLLAAALALASLLVPPAPASARSSPGASASSVVPAAATTEQLRAYWVDAFGEGIYDDTQIDRLVSSVKAANMNAIVAQVVRRGDCFCSDASVPRTEAPIAAAPYDPLRALIAKAHAEGIEVHAWVIVTGIWQGTTAPKDASHAFNTHGLASADSWLTKRSDGLDRVGNEFFLDLGHPDAAAYVVRMATSIVAAYDVDGLNLDRIRYPDDNLGTNVPSWGYNATALARFRAETGRTDTPAPGDAQWAQWRRDRVTDVVRRIYVESYALKPRVRISADTIAYGYGPQTQGGWGSTRTYAELLQDWVGWMREGILDLNIPMAYKRDADAGQRRQYLEWNEYAKEQQYGRHAAIGSALYLNDIASSVRQVHTALAPGASGRSAIGWVGYSWRNPDDAAAASSRTGAASRDELTRALTQPSSYDPVTPAAFASAASVPAMPWKAQPTTGHIRGTVPGLAHGTVELRGASGAALRTTTTDGSGWFGFVDVAPGTYQIAAGATTLSATIVAGQVATATTAAAGPCTGSVGPGIPAPASVPAGVSGFHASWYGQSGYPTLCPGERSTAVVAFYNSGSRGWVRGRMGEVAYLGTWQPEPGQDRASVIGGDGTSGSPDTAWPRFNRVAVQPLDYVGPGQIAWFQFTVQAPAVPGTYRLAIRPLIEGAQWMEDYGVFWYVTVR